MSPAQPRARFLRFLTIAVALLASTALIVPAAAGAATKTQVRVLSGTEMDGFLFVQGDVKTAPKCRAGRKIKLVLKTQGGNSYVGDAGRTTRNGAWGFKAKLKPNTTTARIAVKRQQRGGVTCAKDSAPLES